MFSQGLGDEAEPCGLDLRGTEPAALGEVRRWLAEALRHLGEDELQDVLIVADEILANAYEHTPGPRGVRLTRLPEPHGVMVEVDDGSPEHPRIQPAQPLTRPRGRGLHIVDALCDAWGVHDDPAGGGKTVWVRISG